VWSVDAQEFRRLQGLDAGDVTLTQLLDQSCGLSEEEQLKKYVCFNHYWDSKGYFHYLQGRGHI
jgi:hypothetical protein